MGDSQMKFYTVFLLMAYGCGQPGPGGSEKDAVEADGPKDEASPSEETEKPLSSNDALYIKTSAEMPACDSDGRLVYIQEEAAFKVCAAGNWDVVDIAKDIASKTQVAAETGPVSVNTCFSDSGKSITDTESGEKAEFITRYEVTTMANGSRQISVAVGSKSRGIVWTENFWQKAGTNNFEKITINADVFKQPGGSFELSMNPKMDNLNVYYKDADLGSMQGLMWDIGAAQCKIENI